MAMTFNFSGKTPQEKALEKALEESGLEATPENIRIANEIAKRNQLGGNLFRTGEDLTQSLGQIPTSIPSIAPPSVGPPSMFSQASGQPSIVPPPGGGVARPSLIGPPVIDPMASVANQPPLPDIDFSPPPTRGELAKSIGYMTKIPALPPLTDLERKTQFLRSQGAPPSIEGMQKMAGGYIAPPENTEKARNIALVEEKLGRKLTPDELLRVMGALPPAPPGYRPPDEAAAIRLKQAGRPQMTVNVGEEKLNIQKDIAMAEKRKNILSAKDNKESFDADAPIFNKNNKNNEVAYWDDKPNFFGDSQAKILNLPEFVLKDGWTPAMIQEKAAKHGKTVKQVLKDLKVIR